VNPTGVTVTLKTVIVTVWTAANHPVQEVYFSMWALSYARDANSFIF